MPDIQAELANIKAIAKKIDCYDPMDVLGLEEFCKTNGAELLAAVEAIEEALNGSDRDAA